MPGHRKNKYRRSIALGIFIILATLTVHAEPISIFDDLAASPEIYSSIRAACVNYAPELSPILPEVPGSKSSWYVTQWKRPELLKPDT